MSMRDRRKRSRLMGVSRTVAPRHAPPGTITPPADSPKPQIRVIAYSPQEAIDVRIDDPKQLLQYLHRYPVTWVNVDGLGDPGVIQAIGEIFNIHRLALEDVVHVRQRPKLDEFPQHLYIVARMIERVDDRLTTDQLSLFLGKDYVLTFQERPGDCFDGMRQRIASGPGGQGLAGQGLLRTSGPDLLAYGILDAVVDDYYPFLEADGDSLEELEDDILADPTPDRAAAVHELKRDLLVMRRAVWPLREALAALHRGNSPLVLPETRIYLRDCYDHTVQIIDLLEVYRDLGTSLTELYMTSISNRMNEIVKVLTIISTIFIPLSFIASVYGMNFNTGTSKWNMPELNWPHGYLVALGIMALTAGGMLFYFWRKGWLRAHVTTPKRRDYQE
jgi:magnesium transporter